MALDACGCMPPTAVRAACRLASQPASGGSLSTFRRRRPPVGKSVPSPWLSRPCAKACASNSDPDLLPWRSEDGKTGGRFGHHLAKRVVGDRGREHRKQLVHICARTRDVGQALCGLVVWLNQQHTTVLAWVRVRVKVGVKVRYKVRVQVMVGVRVQVRFRIIVRMRVSLPSRVGRASKLTVLVRQL